VAREDWLEETKQTIKNRSSRITAKECNFLGKMLKCDLCDWHVEGLVLSPVTFIITMT
jgi:hypothetical protein